MRPEGDGVEPPALPQLVQSEQVGVHVVSIVGVGRVVLQVPLSWGLHVLGRPPLRPALIIHHVKAHNLHKQSYRGAGLCCLARLKFAGLSPSAHCKQPAQAANSHASAPNTKAVQVVLINMPDGL